MLCKILNRKLKIEQHESHIQPRLWENGKIFMDVQP